MMVFHPWRNVNGRSQKTTPSKSPDKNLKKKEAAPPRRIGFGIGGGCDNSIPPGGTDTRI